jgi:hypothetical protein
MVKRYVAWYLIVAMFVIGIAPRLEASFAPSEALQSPSVRSLDLDRIRVVLENRLIAQRLTDLGFSPGDIAARLSQMSDEEIHRFAQQLDELKVGGDGGGFVIALLLIAALVVVIIYLSGHRVVVQ